MTRSAALDRSLQIYRAKKGHPLSTVDKYNTHALKWRVAYHMKYHEENTTEDYETWLSKQPKFEYKCRLENCDYIYLRDLTIEPKQTRGGRKNAYQS